MMTMIGRRFGVRGALLAGGLLASSALLAQVAPSPGPAITTRPAAVAPANAPPKVNPEAPVPGNPEYAPDKGQSAEAEVAPPLPPAIWTPVDAQDLLFYIQQVGREGLTPADYDPAGLDSAIRSRNPALISAAATQRFNSLSSDLALGHIRKAARVDWHIIDSDLDSAKQDALLRGALASHNIAASLNSLLPTHPQYAALKSALELNPAGQTARGDRIRLNLDRWRWLPRDLGGKYIIVNVPGFHATLVENGVNRWKQRAIAGSTRTPTPQLTATATGVILNPWWEVPKSIEGEVRGKRGYVPLKGKDGAVQRWRQPPGPSNALGQMKFVMPNSKAIYLHDTNARSRFNDRTRALSHGCIRTQHIVDLAETLLGDDGGEWTPDRVQATLASKKSVQASFVKSLPVYIVYFSSAGLTDGRIVDYKDIYGRDAKAIAALNAKDGGAAKPKADKVAAK
ncbi:MAG: L,D-transpeptidase family protein [Sphingomicrobium sp.]